VTIRALALGAIFTLALLPTTAAALSPIEEVSCPAPVVIDGVNVIPDGAPLDCFYTLEQINADPCALDENGNAPLMCQSQIGGGNCLIDPSAGHCPPPPPCVDTGADTPLREEAIAGTTTRSYLIDTISLVDGGRWSGLNGSLAIEGDQLSASVGCNRMSGLVDRHGTPDSESATPMLLHLRNGLMMTMMFCADLAEAESGLAQILNGDHLALYALDGDRAVIESDAGSASLTLIAETGPVDQGDTVARNGGLFASLLLLFPLLVGALGIAVGLSGDRGRR
jgi:hypothetical protein